MERNNRRWLEGTILSTARDKTVTVQVVRKVRHRIYEKLVEKRKKYHAHDEKNEYTVGQKVRIVQTRPLSKTKCWRVEKVIGEATN